MPRKKKLKIVNCFFFCVCFYFSSFFLDHLRNKLGFSHEYEKLGVCVGLLIIATCGDLHICHHVCDVRVQMRRIYTNCNYYQYKNVIKCDRPTAKIVIKNYFVIKREKMRNTSKKRKACAFLMLVTRYLLFNVRFIYIILYSREKQDK